MGRALVPTLLLSSPCSGLAAYGTSVNFGPDGQILGKHGLTGVRGRELFMSAAPEAPRAPGNSLS
jgi:hypothetical protein